ncbi:DUF1127 domain-containing protein [Iodidimonas sp. SYSU 1G8]|uniref:DUF1127 domain-containing protein n=1 Tax=Iodidimonas sp. SYSU 1G8 TaxID=3133967 RepID=UPI0031FE65CA
MLTIDQSVSASAPNWRGWFIMGFSLAWRDLSALAARIEVAWERQSERRRLGALDDRALKDMGFSRADAWREASKPAWRD